MDQAVSFHHTDALEILETIPLMGPIPGIEPTDPQGQPLTFSGQAADDQWRKFCARRHLWNRAWVRSTPQRVCLDPYDRTRFVPLGILSRAR